MFDKMKQLYELQKQANELKKQLEALRVEKTSKDGRLRVSVNGSLRVEDLTIDPSYLNPEQKTPLERALSSLINETLTDVQKQASMQAAGLMRELPGREP